MVSTAGHWMKLSHQVLLLSHLLSNSSNSWQSGNFYLNNLRWCFHKVSFIAKCDCFVSIILESITSTASTFSVGFSMSGECFFNKTNAYKCIYFVHLMVNLHMSASKIGALNNVERPTDVNGLLRMTNS